MKKIGVSLLLCCLLLTVAFASDTDPKKEALTEMFELMGIDRQMSGGFEAMLPVVDQMAMNMRLNETEKNELKNIYRDWFEKDIDRNSIVAKVSQLYADTFTLEEIKELNKFYKSPVGQKFLEKTPELTKLSAQFGMEEAQAKQPELMKRLEPFFEAQKKKQTK